MLQLLTAFPLYSAGAFEIQKKCRLESSRLCSGWHRSSLSQRDALEMRLLWLPRRINSLAHHLIHRHRAATDSTARKNDINCIALCCVPTIVPGTVAPTACCRILLYLVGLMAHTHTLTRRSTVHGCHRGKKT